MDSHLLEILCCPLNRVPLRKLDQRRLRKLNQAIAANRVLTIRHQPVTQPLEAALIGMDGKLIYPLENDIACLLETAAIGSPQLENF